MTEGGIGGDLWAVLCEAAQRWGSAEALPHADFDEVAGWWMVALLGPPCAEGQAQARSWCARYQQDPRVVLSLWSGEELPPPRLGALRSLGAALGFPDSRNGGLFRVAARHIAHLREAQGHPGRGRRDPHLHAVLDGVAAVAPESLASVRRRIDRELEAVRGEHRVGRAVAAKNDLNASNLATLARMDPQTAQKVVARAPRSGFTSELLRVRGGGASSCGGAHGAGEQLADAARQLATATRALPGGVDVVLRLQTAKGPQYVSLPGASRDGCVPNELARCVSEADSVTAMLELLKSMV